MLKGQIAALTILGLAMHWSGLQCSDETAVPGANGAVPVSAKGQAQALMSGVRPFELLSAL